MFKQKAAYQIIFLFLLTGLFPVIPQMSTQKYKRIKSEHFEIIFPESAKKAAEKAAEIVEKNYQKNQRYLTPKNETRTPVLINNLTLISNGYFTLAPLHSMLYLLPPQKNTFNLFHDSWLEKVAIHEMRHKVQFNFLNRGFNRLLYIIFGEAGWAVGLGLSAPGWFFEGDAVFHETDFVKFGRGRMPNFTSLTRSIVASRKIPTYSQMYLGSNLHVYPDIYEMGYLLTSYMRKKYGPEIFEDILKFSSSWNFIFGPYAFAAGVYNKTNRSIYSIYDSMIRELDNAWSAAYNPADYEKYSSLSKPAGEIYTAYNTPFKNASGLFAYKTGRFQTGSIVKIDPGKSETVLIITGTLSGNLTFNDRFIVWSEQLPDIRWDDISSIVRIYNLHSRKQSSLKLNGRILAPSISADGSKIAAIEFKKNGDSSLVLLDLAGNIIQTIPEPEGITWQTPRWGLNSRLVSLVESSENGKSVVLYNTDSNKIERPMKPVLYQVSDPFVYKNYILFHSDMSGIDNIFSINIVDGKLLQITNSFLGSIQPSVSSDTGKIYFSNFSAKGNYISKMPFDPSTWFPVKKADNLVYTLFHEKINPPLDFSDNSALDGKDFKVENYPDFIKAFNFHSRYIDPTTYLLNSTISAGLISSNVLQTHFMSLFYSYNVLEDLHKVQGEWMFRGWFPVFTLGAFYGYNNGSQTEFESEPVFSQWNETGGYLQSFLPLKFIDGMLEQRLEPGIQFSYSKVEDYILGDNPVTYENHSGFRNYYFLRYFFSVLGNSWLFNRPYFNLKANFNYGPDYLVFNESREFYEGSMLIEFPGFYYNHKISVKGSASYRQDSNDHIFSSTVYLPRGLSTPIYNEFYLASADYMIPLFYPDFNFLYILFIRQVSLNLFYEYIWYVPANESFSEYLGTDLLFHVNLFGLKSEVVLGLRLIYYINTVPLRIEPVPLINIAITGAF